VKPCLRILAVAAGLVILGSGASSASAQRGAGAQTPVPSAAAAGIKLEVIDGSKARYRAQEQLAGINFFSDASGTTELITGTLVLGPDGSISTSQSKLTVDLRGLKSDQDMRDEFIKGRAVLDTDKFPLAEFVPRRTVGLTWRPPASPPDQAGFQLVGDMTIHGVTSEVTWTVIATFGRNQVAGRARTDFTFAKFGIPKPQIARILSVADNINLEIEFRCKRTAL
jgi:polyisoprenoid-binding protein YceI